MTEWLLILHILGAGAWIGANVVQILSNRKLTAAGGQIAESWMRMVVLWGKILYTPAAILILATGIALVLDGPYEFSDAFVSIGFLVIVAGAALGLGVFAKGGERAAVAYAAGDNDAGDAEVRRIVPFGLFDSAIVLVAIAAMVGKWGV